MFEQTFKNLDDLEFEEAQKVELLGTMHAPILDPAHRWLTWAAPKKPDGAPDHDAALTGDDLVEFVNGDLFPYLKAFKARAASPDTIEYKIGEIFGEVRNKFASGYSLRSDFHKRRSRLKRHPDHKCRSTPSGILTS